MNGAEDRLKGLRKAGIGISAITALSLAAIEFKIAVIIGIIAIVGIICQTVLDRGNSVFKKNE